MEAEGTNDDSPRMGPTWSASEDVVAITETARKAMLAAKQAYEFAKVDPAVPKQLLLLMEGTVEATQATLTRSECTRRSRQGFAEFATMLGEEAVETAEGYANEGIRHAERGMRKAKSMIEDHFAIDEAFRLLGPLRQDANFARDIHDWFNLIILLPVIALDLMNWGCPVLPACGILGGESSLPELWHGTCWLTFWWACVAYFMADLLFVMILPHCVRSPKVIIGHHIVSICYAGVPKYLPEFAWFMGSCILVEVNTWFLIARRTFNKRGYKKFSPETPLAKSFFLLWISTCFYITWIMIRLIFYPYLMYVILKESYRHSMDVGSFFNVISISPVFHVCFLCLNLKWTVDLIRSKMKGAKKEASKGL